MYGCKLPLSSFVSYKVFQISKSSRIIPANSFCCCQSLLLRSHCCLTWPQLLLSHRYETTFHDLQTNIIDDKHVGDWSAFSSPLVDDYLKTMNNNRRNSKRKIIYTAKSAFLPYRDCRMNCKESSILCTSCNSLYHYNCKDLSIEDVEYLKKSTNKFKCKNCVYEEKDYPGFDIYDSILRLGLVSKCICFYS